MTGQPLTTELILAKVAALKGLTPAIFYYDKQWFISDYIDGKNITLTKKSLLTKITISLKLMVRFHQLTELSSSTRPEISTLNIADTLANILGSSIFSNNKQQKLRNAFSTLGDQIDTLITAELHNTAFSPVCCHGDINFSNVLTDKNNNTWLIDFEYGCFAPAEYDLAMFIAVNSIPLAHVTLCLDLYEQQANSPLNKQLLYYFILLSYLINGLWYLEHSLNKVSTVNPKAQGAHHQFATKQWQAFDTLYRHLNLPSKDIELHPFI